MSAKAPGPPRAPSRQVTPLTPELLGSTLDARPSSGEHPAVVVPEAGDPGLDPARRYVIGKLLGRGAMGEVRLARDEHLGRQVAMKMLRPGTEGSRGLRSRFLREVRVQAQLEHPAIVPVYDLGRLPDGVEFITMKRVKGQTLHDCLTALKKGEPEATRRYTRRRLLAAFGVVCQAMHYAHQRGVLHRDLKPGNIMLGEYGEVHVLDWGLAKVTGVPDLDDDDELVSSPTIRQSARTQTGDIMGTPGYMSPEQARGEVDSLAAGTDIFALGAILFEILTLERMVPGGDVRAMLHATLTGLESRPSVRAPQAEVPPELEAICQQATRPGPPDRFASAGQMAERIEAFLDGDRDDERRRETASHHAQLAQRAMEAALAGRPEALTDRARAIREVTRAVVLDPHNHDALGLVRRILAEPPAELPPEVAAKEQRAQQRERRDAFYFSAIGAGLWLAFFPVLFFWLGIRHVPTTVVGLLLTLAAAAVAVHGWRTGQTGGNRLVALAVLCSLAVTSFGAFLGPFVIVPGLILQNGVFFAPQLRGRARLGILALSVACAILPFLLELLGILPRSFLFDGRGLVLLARAVELPPVPTLAVLVTATLTMVVMPSMVVSRLRDTLSEAERRLLVYAWDIDQLVPRDLRHVSTTGTHGRPAVSEG